MLCIREELDLIDVEERQSTQRCSTDASQHGRALKDADPSSIRNTIVEMANIHWGDIGGLEAVKQELKETAEDPIRFPELFARFIMIDRAECFSTARLAAGRPTAPRTSVPEGI
jgi:transitional endoplasmic reticulum ATPase